MKEVIGRVLALAITVYLIMITLRIIFSWFNIPRGKFIGFICRYTDPVLDFFRKNTPIQLGVFDVSIVVPIGMLYVLLQIVNDFMIGDHPIAAIINVHYVFKLVLIIVSILFSLVMFLLIIFTIVLIFMKIFTPHSYNPMITPIAAMINPLVDRVRKILKLRSKHAETIYLVIVLALFILLNVMFGRLLAYITIINEIQLSKFISNFLDQKNL